MYEDDKSVNMDEFVWIFIVFFSAKKKSILPGKDKNPLLSCNVYTIWEKEGGRKG